MDQELDVTDLGELTFSAAVSDLATGQTNFFRRLEDARTNVRIVGERLLVFHFEPDRDDLEGTAETFVLRVDVGDLVFLLDDPGAGGEQVGEVSDFVDQVQTRQLDVVGSELSVDSFGRVFASDGDL